MKISRQMVRFDKDVVKFFIPAAAAAIAMFLIGWLVIGLAAVAAAAFMLYFFREPKRQFDCPADVIISPSDGKVVGIETVEEPNYLGGTAKRISIFMNLFDVHINYSPITGKVEFLKYRRGRYISAARAGSSKVNAQNAVGIRNDSTKILVKQIAGVIARRVVCRVKTEDQMLRGQKFGLIRFGSRVEVYLPLECRVMVKNGQRVRGSMTPLATHIEKEK